MSCCRILLAALIICCVYSTRRLQGNNCYKYVDGKCVQCPYRSVNIKGACVAVSDYCKEWNKINAKCLICYEGFELIKGQCIKKQNPPPKAPKPVPVSTVIVTTDTLCVKWNNGKCIGCQYRSVLIKDVCVAVSTQCKYWNNKTAQCIQCYVGFQLKEGQCMKIV